MDHENYSRQTNQITTTMLFLLGVPEDQLEQEQGPFDRETVQRLNREKELQILRHEYILLTEFMQRFQAINQNIYYDTRSIRELPHLISRESLDYLEANDIAVVKANYSTKQYIMHLNGLIAQQVSACRKYFPLEVEWAFIKSLFVVPEGTTERGIKREAERYRRQSWCYPFGTYFHWEGYLDREMFSGDRKFLTELYRAHGKKFPEHLLAQVLAQGEAGPKETVYRFLESSSSATILIDCENADPFLALSMLAGLGDESLLEKVKKVILFDDPHTSSAWQLLGNFTKLPVERREVTRILKNKSRVDAKLIIDATREVDRGETDAFILVSSDSDFSALIEGPPEVRFLVMTEEAKCSETYKESLKRIGAQICSMERFSTPNSDDLRDSALEWDMRSQLTTVLPDLNALLAQAIQSLRLNLTKDQQRQLREKFIQTAKITFSNSGRPVIQFA